MTGQSRNSPRTFFEKKNQRQWCFRAVFCTSPLVFSLVLWLVELKEWREDKKKKMVRERLTFYPLFIPQMPTIARAEPDPNQKPRTLSRPHLQQQFKSLSHHLLLSRKHISKKNCSQVLTQSTPVWDTDIWSGSFIYCATMCASIY